MAFAVGRPTHLSAVPPPAHLPGLPQLWCPPVVRWRREPRAGVGGGGGGNRSKQEGGRGSFPRVKVELGLFVPLVLRIGPVHSLTEATVC